MADGHVVADHTGEIIGDVAHAVVLNVGMMADHHAVDVTTQDAAEPDAGLFANFGVTDDPRGVGDKHACADPRPPPEVIQHGRHGVNSGDVRCKMQSSFGKIPRDNMVKDRPTPPQWIIARLGEDLNWWVDESSADIFWGEGGRGLLDPRQVAYLAEHWNEYQPYGLRRQLLEDACQFFEIESELDDERVRLAPVAADGVESGGGQIFALPLVEDEETGAYYDFLDAISTARIRKLNATHHYARNCTELDMREELETLDHDRYFSSESIHCFDEINEILQWSPAEWDEPAT